jgi:molybdopterin-guanine dinucleotide biosynthesis protein A
MSEPAHGSTPVVPAPDRAAGITGVILCGGLGRRMADADKGLVRLAGRTLVEHVIARLAPQVDTLLLNANRNVERYAAFGYPVVPDTIDGFVGPLAGLHAALGCTTHDRVVMVPCDSPYLPLDLVARLAAPLDADPAVDVAIARLGDQSQPVFCLARTRVRGDVAACLASGERRVRRWAARLTTVEVPFDDQPRAFDNFNTPDAIAAAESAGESAGQSPAESAHGSAAGSSRDPR